MVAPNPWGLSLHIPLLIILQILFIILFALFARYDPASAYRNQYHSHLGDGSVDHGHHLLANTYPMFQDVPVMIFFGIGFLYTFLKRYGLSAVSLNMMISGLCIQWTILVRGFLHPHYDLCQDDSGHNKRAVTKALFNTNCWSNWPWIDINITTLLNAEFATAAVLITFGVVLGTSSPVQLIIMAIIELILFNINEVIGRSYLKAVDVGDTIFIHLFSAYYGLAMSRVLYDKSTTESSKAGSTRISDLFSMMGTVFLWMFWPSFNGSGAAVGDAQMRAVINTYLSLCVSCISAFAVSALVNPQKRFCMEHIQNATLAGGVVIGAVADMVVTPCGSMVAGAMAGAISTIGYEHISPYVVRKLKITDTCGVNNLHGMPAILGGLLSVLLADIATKEEYDQYNIDRDDPDKSGLVEIFPERKSEDWTGGTQAGRQLAAMVVTLVIAIVGGFLTGYILKFVAHQQIRYKPGSTITKLALNIGHVMVPRNIPKDFHFDDQGYFAMEEEENDKDMSKNYGLTMN